MSADGKNRLVEDWFKFAGEDLEAASVIEAFIRGKRA
jgi:hypothetical protein